MLRKVASNLLHLDGALHRSPLVTFDDSSGEILSVELGVESIDGCSGVEFYSGVMCAGFINMHAHVELSHLRGKISEGCGFAAFAGAVGSLRRGDKMQGEAEQQSTILNAISSADLEMQREGIVAVADIVNDSSSFAMKGRSSIEYYSFAEVFGLGRDNLEDCRRLLEHPCTSLTPHSTYSLRDEVFRSVAAASSALPLCIHFKESPGEAELFECRGALWEWFEGAGFDVDFLGYGGCAERLVGSVPSDRALCLVHNCCVTRGDLDLIMGHFSAPVSWVLCPESNRYISGSLPPLSLLQDYRTADGRVLNICLGTDSLASATSLSMLSQLRLLQEGCGGALATLLDYATANGAKALGLSHLGSIAVGKRPGINILSGIDYDRLLLCDGSSLRTIL